ncbi:MAG: pyridoxamine 5'-phosphate oxidase [Verrucomicrobia bacterium]|nr:pyridoxamine 5'-phosphate oxidase [Verrucomicrobiota bacterium]
MTLTEFRKEYTMSGLRRRDLAADPFTQFQKWFNEAVEAQVPEPTAMTLATADKSGQPSARTVLLKSFDERGFIFCTNYLSQKGLELENNPHACMVFFWKELERQVAIRGTVTKVPRAESELYFQARPVGSRLGAWVSQQSTPVSDRAFLEEKFREMEQKFPGENVPCPEYWGGYVLAPITIEFWQGRVNRLHDRFRFTKQTDKMWLTERLSP